MKNNSKNNSISNAYITSFIYKVLYPFRSSLYVMFAAAITWAIDLSLRPYVLKIIIDRISEVSTHSLFESIKTPVVIYFSMSFFYQSVWRFYQYVVDINMIPAMRRSIAHTSFDSLMQQSYSYYQHNFSGGLTNKVNDLTSSVPEIIQIMVDRFFGHTVALIIAIITLSRVNSIFALGMLTWSVVFLVGSFFLSKRIARLADNWSECGAAITGRVVDSLSNILSIRLFAREKHERNLLTTSLSDAVKAEQKLQWTYFWIWFCYGYSFLLVQGLSLFTLLKGRQEGWITIGDFVVVLTINYSIVDFLWQFARDFAQFSKLWGRVMQALRAIQVTPEIQDSPYATQLAVSQGRIVFDNVKFHYKGAENLFENKTVEIEPGQKVGLVGFSGGGKSTFINLILRLFDVTEGRILIDGQDISLVTQDSLHEAIGVIPQEPLLFNRSLLENIRYGRIHATDEEVIEAAKKADVHEFISELAHGYNEVVGERGAKLSGGQRQRIAVARAILKNAPILILDEATSQLDTVTERKIQASLWQLMRGKTTLVVAHRLSTLLHMDRILVFEYGEIVEDGSHEELLQQDGLYKKLWNAQVDGFLPGAEGQALR